MLPSTEIGPKSVAPPLRKAAKVPQDIKDFQYNSNFDDPRDHKLHNLQKSNSDNSLKMISNTNQTQTSRELPMHISTDVLQGVPGRIPKGKISKSPYKDPSYKPRPDAFNNFKAELYNSSLPTDV
jgi:hypothetical protein